MLGPSGERTLKGGHEARALSKEVLKVEHEGRGEHEAVETVEEAAVPRKEPARIFHADVALKAGFQQVASLREASDQDAQEDSPSPGDSKPRRSRQPRPQCGAHEAAYRAGYRLAGGNAGRKERSPQRSADEKRGGIGGPGAAHRHDGPHHALRPGTQQDEMTETEHDEET